MRSVKTNFLAIVLLIFAAIHSAHAQDWQMIYAKPGRYFIEADASTLIKLDEGLYRATWRTGTLPGTPERETTGLIDCNEESIQLERRRRIETNATLARLNPNELVTDYIKGESVYGTRVSKLSAKEMEGRWEFPSGVSLEGKLIRYSCQVRADWPLRMVNVVQKFQAVGQCDKGEDAHPFVCSKEPEKLEAIRNHFLRMEQVRKACSVPQDDASLVSFAMLDEADRNCANSRTSECGLLGVSLTSDGLVSDLTRARSSQECTSIARYVTKAKEEKASSESAHKFRVCVQKTIPSMDDRVSSADVVADAVMASCRGVLHESLSSNKAFFIASRPHITGLVLQARQAKRKK